MNDSRLREAIKTMIRTKVRRPRAVEQTRRFEAAGWEKGQRGRADFYTKRVDAKPGSGYEWYHVNLSSSPGNDTWTALVVKKPSGRAQSPAQTIFRGVQGLSAAQRRADQWLARQ